MTDEEVICAWMGGPMPAVPEHFSGVDELPIASGWWVATTTGYLSGDANIVIPRLLTLNECREVEATLSTPGQWWEYYTALCAVTGEAVSVAFRHLIHASAEQKINALAVVIRGAK